MADDDYTSRLHAFETLLDPSRNATESKVEMNSFRRLCARGIPSHPPHLRPLSYSLLLSLLPPDKTNWTTETKRLRLGYYELVRAYSSELESAEEQNKEKEKDKEKDERGKEKKEVRSGWLERKETVKEKDKEKGLLSSHEKLLLAIVKDVEGISSEGDIHEEGRNWTEVAGGWFMDGKGPRRISRMNPLGGKGVGSKGKGIGKGKGKEGEKPVDDDEESDTSGISDQEGNGSIPYDRNQPYGSTILNRRSIFRHIKTLQDKQQRAIEKERQEKLSLPSGSGSGFGSGERPGMGDRETLFSYDGRSPSPSVMGREDGGAETDGEGGIRSPPSGIIEDKSKGLSSQEMEVPNRLSKEDSAIKSPMIVLSPSQDQENEQVVEDSGAASRRRRRLPRAPEIVPDTASNSTTAAAEGTASLSDSVTLLQSQTLPPRSASLSGTTGDKDQWKEEEDSNKPDTHAESLVRLLWVFTKTHKRWRYSTGVMHIAAALFRIYASGGEIKDMSLKRNLQPRYSKSRSGKPISTIQEEGSDDADDEPEEEQEDLSCLNGWQRHAEANTYWALTGFMNELGGMIAGCAVEGMGGEEDGMVDLLGGMHKLRSRIRWADENLWRGLTLRGLDPGSPLFANRWLSGIFSSDIPIPYLLPLWDFILAEQSGSAKADVIIDLSTALLYLVKKDLLKRSISGVHPATAGQKGHAATMWADSAESPLVDYGDLTRLTEEEREDALVKGVRLLRNYPIHRVGVHEVLKFAWEIKQERIMAGLEGQGPDDVIADPEDVPQDDEDLYGYLAPLGGIAQKATETLQQATSYGQPLTASLSAGVKQYTQSFQDSDAAAMIAKASTNFSVAALSRWSTIGKKASVESLSSMARTVQSSVSLPTTEDSATGKIWNAIPGISSPKRSSLDAKPKPTTLAPEPSDLGADLYRRDSSLPPSFISHRGSIVYPAGKYRQRGGGAVSVQSRLAAIANSMSKTATPSTPSDRSSMKPLMLSPTNSPGDQGPQSAADTSSRAHRIERASAKLNTAVKPRLQRARPTVGPAVGSESESGVDGQRYALRDDGGGSGSGKVELSGNPDDVDSAKKYSLSDAPVRPAHQTSEGSDLARHDSGDSFHSLDNADDQRAGVGLARKKVIRKGRVASRPTKLRLGSIDSTMSSEGEAGTSDSQLDGSGKAGRHVLSKELQASMPSPLLEEPPEPASTLPRPSTIRAVVPPSSRPRVPSGPRRLPGSSPRAKQQSGSTGQPIKSVASDADEEDEVEGNKSFDSRIQAKDGYGDLLDSYGALGDI